MVQPFGARAVQPTCYQLGCATKGALDGTAYARPFWPESLRALGGNVFGRTIDEAVDGAARRTAPDVHDAADVAATWVQGIRV
jgi:hypothetical protein